MVLGVVRADLPGAIQRLHHAEWFPCGPHVSAGGDADSADRRSPCRRKTSHAAMWVAMCSGQNCCRVVRNLRASASGSAARISFSPSGSSSVDFVSSLAGSLPPPLPDCSAPAPNEWFSREGGLVGQGCDSPCFFALALASALRFLLSAFFLSFSGRWPADGSLRQASPNMSNAHALNSSSAFAALSDTGLSNNRV